MTEVEAFITLARRYCKDNFSYWSDRYSRERTGNDFPYTYTDNDYNLFPRYNVLSAILSGVETLLGQNFQNIESCREALNQIAWSAQSPLTEGEQNEIEQNAMKEERVKFAGYIQGLSPNDFLNVEPLPYRRRLRKEEKALVRAALLDKWNYDGDYWDPLVGNSPHKVVFLRKECFTDNDFKQIIEFVTATTQGYLYEVTEEGNDAEIECSLFHPDCYETVYVDKTFEWIVYGSHESTITFGGDVLTNFIENLFSDRKAKLNSWEL